ncbi:MAG: hypothetical protein KAI50_01350 [Desulfobacterales bacterium]|nr:hypothetical protein [Desulfobacterales bacterium]
MAAFVESMGFGIVPDVRYHKMKPNIDGKVIIFQHGRGADFQPSKEFHTVGTILRLAAITEKERKT